MARNGSGTMSVLNSFSPDTTIESAKANANNLDVAAEITNSLPRDGQAGMTGQFKAANGNAASPGISFGSDTNTGFFRKSGDVIGIAIGGLEVGSIDASGLLDVLGVRVLGIPTGAIMSFGATSAPTGWVRMNARTIGNASSSATERANADTASLFAFLWNNYTDDLCPVSGGRGASATADYAANKTIGLPDWRGRTIFGLDDMGNSAAGRISLVDGTVNGQVGGAESVTLDRADLPNVSVDVDISEDPHDHNYTRYNSLFNNLGTDGPSVSNVWVGTQSRQTTTASTGLSGSFNLNDDQVQTEVNKLPPLAFSTFIMKL